MIVNILVKLIKRYNLKISYYYYMVKTATPSPENTALTAADASFKGKFFDFTEIFLSFTKLWT